MWAAAGRPRFWYHGGMKAATAGEAKKLLDIPNIGQAMVRDFALLGITKPTDLQGNDPFRLYQKMCKLSKTRQDPCVLDTYMAAIDFMDGAPARPWWYYTASRKMQYPDL